MMAGSPPALRRAESSGSEKPSARVSPCRCGGSSSEVDSADSDDAELGWLVRISVDRGFLGAHQYAPRPTTAMAAPPAHGSHAVRVLLGARAGAGVGA